MRSRNYLECNQKIQEKFLVYLKTKRTIKNYGFSKFSKDATMATHIRKPTNSLRTSKSGQLKSPRIYIDPHDFHLMRRRAFLTTLEALRLLDSHKAIQNWEKACSYPLHRLFSFKKDKSRASIRR